MNSLILKMKDTRFFAVVIFSYFKKLYVSESMFEPVRNDWHKRNLWFDIRNAEKLKIAWLRPSKIIHNVQPINFIQLVK